MPVKTFAPSRSPDQARLVDELSQEWRAPNPSAVEPVILEEKDSAGQVNHVYVVWSDWSRMDRIQRGEVIMDAAERILPKPQVLAITIAMGLTPDEADRFGIRWRA